MCFWLSNRVTTVSISNFLQQIPKKIKNYEKLTRLLPGCSTRTHYVILRFFNFFFIFDRFLGIRSPLRVLEHYNEQLYLNSSNTEESVRSQLIRNESEEPIKHEIHKRHIPHKFWAKARPHNKFKRRKKVIVANFK